MERLDLDKPDPPLWCGRPQQCVVYLRELLYGGGGQSHILHYLQQWRSALMEWYNLDKPYPPLKCEQPQ